VRLNLEVEKGNLEMESKQWYSLLGWLVGSCFLRSLLIPIFFQIMRIHQPLYSSGSCLLQLVNETTTIESNHHPFYRTAFFERNCDLDHYVKLQFENHEDVFFNIFLVGLLATVIICFYFTWKQIFSLRYIIIILVGYHLQLLQHCYMHFGQDVTFLAGNVMHHADISRFPYGKSEFLSGATPDGVAFTIVISIIWSMFARSIILQLDPVLRNYIDWRALIVATASMGLYIAARAKYSHNVWHTTAIEGMQYSLPFTEDYFAYQHVFVHHQTGGAFGPNPFFDPFFSVALNLYGYLHNSVFKLTVPSMENIIFAVFFDFLIGCIVMFGYWIILRFAKFLDHLFFDKQESEGKIL
jgi:hypothetical protein